jgi:N-acetylneuraminate lyase
MKGIFSALLSAFYDNGAPNFAAQKDIINYNIEKCKIDGLYVNGSTGENFNVPHQHKQAIIASAADQTNNRVTLIAQIGSNILEEIYELADLAAEYGYKAVSAVAPIYFSYSKSEIINHYLRIAEYSKLPLIIYNIPVRTSVVLKNDDFDKLLSHANISGVKFTSSDFYLLENIRATHPNKVLYSGFDEMLLSAAVLGTDGAIGSTYNICGHWAKAVYEAVQTGDLETARLYQHKINQVVKKLLDSGALISTLKACFEVRGINAGNCRLPVAPISDEQRKIAGQMMTFIENN